MFMPTTRVLLIVVACASCGSKNGAPEDGSVASFDFALGGSSDGGGGDGDGGSNACRWSGAPGTCITTSACATMPGYTSEPGSCPGPTTIPCCIVTPSVANNPPTPPGYKLMQQSMVTPEMTTWAVMILDDPLTYSMFSTTTMTFGAQPVLARVEWHPPDFNNSAVHRGVTLYIPG
jgi:hypothetical protein